MYKFTSVKEYFEILTKNLLCQFLNHNAFFTSAKLAQTATKMFKFW